MKYKVFTRFWSYFGVEMIILGVKLEILGVVGSNTTVSIVHAARTTQIPRYHDTHTTRMPRYPYTSLPHYYDARRLATTVRVVEGVFEKVLVVSSNNLTAAGRAAPLGQLEGREAQLR